MRVSSILIAAALCCGVVHGAEQAPATEKPATPAATAAPEQSPAKPAEAKPSATAARAAEEDKDKDKDETPPAAKAPGDQKASPQRFIPSEQVRADFDVSFPIDI